MKINTTTRTYPRTMQDAFPRTYYAEQHRDRWEWMEGHKSDNSAQAEFLTYITLAFAAGFLVSHIWG
jgi:hypothetical protein